MAFQLKNKAELRKWTKALKARQIKTEIGESSAEIILKQEVEIERLKKQVKGLLSSIEQINKRLYKLEMREYGENIPEIQNESF